MTTKRAEGGRWGDTMSPARYRVQLLSTFEVSQHDRAVRLPSSVARLVAYLAISGAPTDRHRVCGDLWGDIDEVRAAGSLRTAIWRASRSAPDLLCATTGTTIGLANAEIDFEPARAIARSIVQREVSVRSADPGEPAGWIELLQSELLPGWHDEWVQLPQGRWKQLRLHALEALSDQARACGRFVLAHDAALVAVGIEPLRESPHRCVIQAHLDEGNHADAVTHYRSYAALLREQLSVAPSMLLSDLMASAGSPQPLGRWRYDRDTLGTHSA